MVQQVEFSVEKEYEGLRLDIYINKKLIDKSRSTVQKLLGDGFVKVDGKVEKSSYKVKEANSILVTIPELEKLEIEAQDIPIEVIYEDNDIAVINKQKGMVVHPACGNYSGTLVNALLYNCKNLSGINGVIRPGIVHRIDKDTSGVLVIAKNDNAHTKLSEQLKKHTMNRIYYALVHGEIKANSGKIEAAIGRHKTDRKKMSVVTKGGKNAVTYFEVLERFSGYSFIRAKLETGRTHQIRVHMSYIGHPLVGDEVYGYKKQKISIKGQMLHAAVLGFIHPTTEQYMEFETALPVEFTELLEKLRVKDARIPPLF
ncbi:MAG: RluA family pseudouridine synthase [Deltaproteobacteria bacterium]